MADDKSINVSGTVAEPDVATLNWGVPVDSEYKSKVLRIWSWRRPHHLSFHLNWIQFFIAFTSTFAAAALLPVIRDDLDLTKPQLSKAGIAAVTGTIACRIAMGPICDNLGPRYGAAFLMMLTSCATYGMALVTNYAGFVISRMVIGFSLASFVVCQFWCSIMFSPNIVGTANAVAGGWGNMGGGATQLLMPMLYKGFQSIHSNFIAWRVSYFIPGTLQIIIGMAILIFAQDLPLGNYRALKKSGLMKKGNPKREFIAGVANYRTWVLLLTYGYCFGVELTVDNVVHSYFHDQFGLSIFISGVWASVFGMQNLYARALGGWVSDLTAKRWGMRGRLWTLWITQSLGGVCCILMGISVVYNSFPLTMVVIVVFSIFVPMACGATYGIVPFVSRRALGVVCGLVGAGGNAGSAITQAAFFTSASMSTTDGFIWMGVLVLCVTMLVWTLYFPMWGGMVCPAREGWTEEKYFARDFTQEERDSGVHHTILKFANESRSMRGMKSLQKYEATKQVDDKTTNAAGKPANVNTI
jgi:MFS transporter, NNP family, nitrate/nitrite transporter